MMLTVDWRDELHERLSKLNEIKDNLESAKAELEVVKQRDPLTRTKSKSESCGAGDNTEHISVFLSRRENHLNKLIYEYNAMLNDIDRGWRMLSRKEKNIMEYRFIKGHTQEETSNHYRIDVRTVQRIERKATDKMLMHMTKM